MCLVGQARQCLGFGGKINLGQQSGDDVGSPLPRPYRIKSTSEGRQQRSQNRPKVMPVFSSRLHDLVN